MTPGQSSDNSDRGTSFQHCVSHRIVCRAAGTGIWLGPVCTAFLNITSCALNLPGLEAQQHLTHVRPPWVHPAGKVASVAAVTAHRLRGGQAARRPGSHAMPLDTCGNHKPVGQSLKWIGKPEIQLYSDTTLQRGQEGVGGLVSACWTGHIWSLGSGETGLQGGSGECQDGGGTD